LGSSGSPSQGARLLSKPYRKEELRRAVREALDDTPAGIQAAR
jgi:hypothetical protein